MLGSVVQESHILMIEFEKSSPSYLNSVNFISYFYKIYFSIILPPKTMNVPWSLSLMFSNQHFLRIYSFSMRAIYPESLIILSFVMSADTEYETCRVYPLFC
jgi:hypothetical protein